MLKRIVWVAIATGAMIAAILASALMGSVVSTTASQLPDNCTKERGTVTCTTTEGPGKNQGGVGTTETEETKGNTKNKNPEPQDLQDDCTKRPPTAQGGPIGDCPA